MRGRVWLATALAVGAFLVIPSTSGAQVPAQDSVTGSGVAGSFWGQFEIDASSGPSGENPTGQVRTSALNGRVSGPVTCLAVRGNIATLNIEAVETPGTVVTLEVTDGAVAGVPDVIVGAATGFAHGRVPTDCSPLILGVREEVSSGDIAVHDAPPLPTSKDQCKNGGWRQYGVFKNQGDCVSFVATGGKNPPAGP